MFLQRDVLKDFCNQTLVYTGKIVRFHSCIQTQVPIVLLQQIYHNNKFISEHLWIRNPPEVVMTLPLGCRIEFSAVAYAYTKKKVVGRRGKQRMSAILCYGLKDLILIERKQA